MIRAFADASMLYSAVISSSGASRELLRRHRSGDIQLVVSDYVLSETKRNLAKDVPTLSGSIDLLLDVLIFDIVEVAVEAVKAAATYTEIKDAPVVAAARSGNCEYLLTFDRKHLIDPSEVAEKSGLKIVTPGDLLQLLQVNE